MYLHLLMYWSEVFDDPHGRGLLQVKVLSHQFLTRVNKNTADQNLENISLPPQKDCPLVHNFLNP